MFSKYSDIGQFRNIIRQVTDKAQFTGMVDGEPTFDKLAKLPIIEVEATEKIHGTNACVGYSHEKGIWVQSRGNIITPEKDNAGCAKFVQDNEDAWYEVIRELLDDRAMYDASIYIYFEWCGGSIQKNTAVQGLDKRAVIFRHFKVLSTEDDVSWYNTEGIDAPYANIYNVGNYNTWKFTIDFSKPLLSQNALVSTVEDIIEPNSPLGKAMGVDGNIGEGMVCTFVYKDELYKFKVKGDKHSKSKVKTLKPVDEVFENAKIDFANYATASFRLEQALDALCGLAEDRIVPDIKMTGDFLRLVIADVKKEESDIMKEKGLTDKDVNANISKIARLWFMEQL